MTVENIINKVHKLLRLSAANINTEEAASAAAKAQELIDQHNLSAAMLALDNAEPNNSVDDEPVVDFFAAGAPLDRGKQQQRWRTTLASVIAGKNGCRIYLNGGNIALVGRPSDAETVRYLYGYLSRETERLASFYVGMGRTWRNNFRLGVVDTISTKLHEQHRKFESGVRATARLEGGTALMRIDRVLANIDARGETVQEWMDEKLKLTKGRGHTVRGNSEARARGRQEGASINIGSRSNLVSGAKGLKP